LTGNFRREMSFSTKDSRQMAAKALQRTANASNRSHTPSKLK
jgi:hypothetical protein